MIFVKGNLCFKDLLKLFEGVNMHVDKRNLADIIHSDFQKAFNTVPHQRLKKKSIATGLEGRFLFLDVELVKR